MGSVAQIACWPEFPLSQTDLSLGLSDGCAECGEAVQYGDPDLELRNLTVEVSGGQALTQQLGFVAKSCV